MRSHVSAESAFFLIMGVPLTGLDNCKYTLYFDYLKIPFSRLFFIDSLRGEVESSQRSKSQPQVEFLFYFQSWEAQTAAHVTQAAAKTHSKYIIGVKLPNEGSGSKAGLGWMKCYSRVWHFKKSWNFLNIPANKLHDVIVRKQQTAADSFGDQLLSNDTAQKEKCFCCSNMTFAYKRLLSIIDRLSDNSMSNNIKI